MNPSAQSAAKKRRLVMITGFVLLTGALVFFVTRNHEEASAPASVDRPYLVPAPPLPPMDRLDNPEADGWPTEVLAEEAKQQLKLLGKFILNPEKFEEEKLQEIVTQELSFQLLEADEAGEVYSDSALRVTRSPQQPKGSRSQGISDFKSALQKLGSPLQGATDLRFEPKVFRVHLEKGGFRTRQFIAISGITKNGVIEHHATWETRWMKDDKDSSPRLATLEVGDIEKIQTTTPGRTLFADCTESLFGANESFREQLGRGYGHWLRRSQDSQYFFWLGIPGMALGDVNGDGLDDLYLCQEDGLPNRLFLQNSDGSLRDESEAAGVNWLEGSRSALIVDLDSDGDQDLAVAVMGGIVIAANQGEGKFEYRSFLPTSDDLMSMSAADYDEDGLLDLYVCTYFQNGSDGPRSRSTGVAGGAFVYHDSNSGGPNHLFKNESKNAGAFQFRDVTVETGLDQHNLRWSLAASWEDYDNDGDQDLYVANDFGRNNLFRNDGGKFVDVAAESGVEDSASGMAVTWGDYDRNGHMDVYVSNMFSAAGNRITFQEQFKPNAPPEVRSRLQRFARGSTLMKAGDEGGFTDVSEAMGVEMARWAWGTSFVDLNNDGWEDIVVANGNITGEDPGDL